MEMTVVRRREGVCLMIYRGSEVGWTCSAFPIGTCISFISPLSAGKVTAWEVIGELMGEPREMLILNPIDDLPGAEPGFVSCQATPNALKELQMEETLEAPDANHRRRASI